LAEKKKKNKTVISKTHEAHIGHQTEHSNVSQKYHIDMKHECTDS